MSIQKKSTPIVALCGSAGETDAFKSFLSHTPDQKGLAYIIIQHLSEHKKRLLPDILKSASSLPVLQIENQTIIQPDHIYVIPPNRLLRIEGNQLLAEIPPREEQLIKVADIFLKSLAHEYSESAVAVILSGTGSDGSAGIKQIKENNGLVIVQAPDSAKHNGMIENAIQTNMADYILHPDEMPEVILDHFAQKQERKLMIELSDEDYNRYASQIFDILRQRTGQDFSKYKRNTLFRRLERRLNSKKIKNLSEYLALLNNDKDEALALNKELLISVSSFFRDPKAFDFLAKEVIPKIVKTAINKTIRIWIPACATGEEAYSIAMLVDHYLSKHNLKHNLKIFASDIDLWAIERAREGLYPASIKNAVPKEFLSAYFTPIDQQYKINQHIRDLIIFAEQNVLGHPPYSSLNLISCRNLLIYLDNELQERVLSTFHYALLNNGYLFLGNSENLGNSSNLYSIVDRKTKIFRKMDQPVTKTPQWMFANPKYHDKINIMHEKKNQQLNLSDLTKELVLNRFTPPSIIINSNEDILFLQGETSKFLEMPPGEPTLNIIQAAKDSIRLKLAHAIRNAKKHNTPIVKKNIKFKNGEFTEFVDLVVEPIKNGEISNDLYLIIFKNSQLITNNDQLELADSKQNEDQLKELGKELKETQEYLQKTIEELESANEELKASNEEEQSINEELQSANEELETSKEELQSVNEELNNSNIQLYNKIDELTQVNNDISNLLSSTQIATIFIDKKLKIFRFTPSISSIMDLLDSDIGRSIKQFTNKLKYSGFISDLKDVLENLNPKEIEVQTEDNRFFWMKINPYKTIDNTNEGLVITFTDITENKKQGAELLKYKDHLEELVEERTQELIESYQTVSEEKRKAQQYLEIAEVIIVAMDTSGKVTLANRKAAEILGYQQDEIIGKSWIDHFIPEQERNNVKDAIEHIVSGNLEYEKYRKNNILTKDGTEKMIAWNNAYIKNEKGEIVGLISSGQDITEELKTLSALQQSEENLQRAQKAGNIGMWILDLRTQMVSCSEIFQHIHGFKKPLIHAEELMLFIPEKERQVFKKSIEETLQGIGNFKSEHRIVNQKTKSIKWVSDKAELIFDKNGNPEKIIGTTQDITERVRTTQALAESEKKFKDVFDYSITGIALADRQGNLLDANAEFIRILGYSKEELLTKNFADFTCQDDLSQELEFLNKMHSAQLDSYRLEKRYIRATGEIIWVDIAVTAKRNSEGEIVQFIGMASDISARKEFELQLQNRNEFIQTILDNLPIGVATNEIDTGKTSYLNSKFEELYGWDKSEMSNVESFFKNVHPKNELGEEMKAQILEDINSGDPLRMLWKNLVITRKDGSQRIVNAVNIPLLKQNNMVSTVIDITDLKKTEEELIAAKNMAEQANALKSAFLANTSHEIRTPLNGIIGFTELLEELVPKNSKTKTYIDIIKSSGDQLLKIIDDIIDLSKIDSNQLSLHNEVFGLNALLDEIFSFHQHSKLKAENSNVKIKLKKESSELIVLADRFRLKQILDNLITNALKQTDIGYVEFGYSIKPNGRITLFVKDTGVGIEENKIEQIFDRFVKLRSKSGTGLGLSIVKGLVNLLDGEIKVKSEVNIGTTFEVSFFIKDSKFRKIRKEMEVVSKGNKQMDWSRKVLLVVEDDLNSFLLIEAILKDTEAKLIHVKSGDEIVNSYKANNPDLILMDINMPVVNGFDATQMIRKIDPQIPIIAQTAYAMENEKIKCMEAGCNDYISKPIDRKKLIQIISKLLV